MVRRGARERGGGGVGVGVRVRTGMLFSKSSLLYRKLPLGVKTKINLRVNNLHNKKLTWKSL